MPPKPIFIGSAAAILILVVAAASFSAGLYLGQRGYVDSLQYQQQQAGPAGQFPQGASPQTGPGIGQQPLSGPGPIGAPTWPPDMIGPIVSIGPTEMEIDTSNGYIKVFITPEIVYLGQQGRPITFNDLRVGFVVAVFGWPKTTSIMHLPPPPNQP